MSTLEQGPSDYLEEQVPASRIISILEKFSGLDEDGTLKERLLQLTQLTVLIYFHRVLIHLFK